MTTIQNSFKRFSSLLRITMAAALLLTGLALAPSAQATPLNLFSQQPDILVSDLQRTGLTYGTDLKFTHTILSWFEAPPASSLTIYDGSYLLDTVNNIFLISGDTGTGFHSLLAGKIIDYDLNGGSFYEFLIDIDSFDSALGDFGTRAGIIIAGSNFNSDNFSTPVPEPSTIILLTAGLAALVAIRRRCI